MSCEVPPASEFADFMFVDAACFTAHHTQALTQATFLTSMMSGCPDCSTLTGQCAQLFKYAIFDMARWMFFSAPWVQVQAMPYQSETVGNYTYTRGIKASFLQGWQTGRWNTGVFWFDLFLKECFCGAGNVYSDAITVFEHENVYIESGTGRRWVLGPRELVPSGFDSAFGSSDGVSSGFASGGGQVFTRDPADPV